MPGSGLNGPSGSRVYRVMKPCLEFTDRVTLLAGGDLDREAAAGVRRHLEGCTACRQELSEYENVLRVARRSFVETRGLDDHVRARIARAAAEGVLRPSWWRRLVPLSASPLHATLVPAAIVAVLAVGVLPLALRTPHPVGVQVEGPVRIDMQADGTSVRLAWTDGRGRPYRVYKSSNPRLLGSGPAQEVRGNQWVDKDPESSPIVYYRVE
jgi:putative zinc finger protein